MNAIDRPGTFRGLITDCGVSETKNGFPQFTATLKALEFYNEEDSSWVAWGEFEQEMTGFFVLYSKEKDGPKAGQWKELLNVRQLKQALGWDGASFAALASGDYSTKMVLFRVEDNEYQGNKSLKVTWIDAHDASPVKTLAKYDTAKLKDLDSRFAGVMKAPAPTPAKAPAKGAAPKGAVTPPKRGPGRPPKAAAPVPTPPAGQPQPESAATASVGPTAQTLARPAETTMDQAWDDCLSISGVKDQELADVWLDEVQKLGTPEEQITPAGWATVREAVLNRTSKF